MAAVVVSSSCTGNGEPEIGVGTPGAPVEITEPRQGQQLERREFHVIRGERSNGAARVDVAVGRVVGNRCVWLRLMERSEVRRELRRKHPRLFPPVQVFGPRAASCERPVWHRARLRPRTWTYAVDCATPRGNYRVLARGVGPSGRWSDGVVFRVV